MNRVITLAEDNNMKIYYQDTDSLHIEDKHINKLSELFYQKYKKQLIGENLEQFHTDFKLSDCDDKSVYSSDSIFLGKKCYIDCLIGKDKTGAEKRGYHIRMKGVPTSSINHYCDENKISPLQLYKDLKDGKEVEFNLLAGSCKFEYRNSQVYSRTHFTRKIKF
jgi:hypothetical protein